MSAKLLSSFNIYGVRAQVEIGHAGRSSQKEEKREKKDMDRDAPVPSRYGGDDEDEVLDDRDAVVVPLRVQEVQQIRGYAN